MDKRPISEDRARAIGADEPDLRRGLAELAHQVYTALDLQSLVRLDVRADADGTLYVLEANPKPDLKRPGEGVSSLIMIGLGNDAESYRDLIYGLLADRLHYLFSYRREAIAHIVNLIPAPFGTRSRFTHLSINGA
jgi:D-alanine-D-alanine ligase